MIHLFSQGIPNNVEKRETGTPTLQSNVKLCEQGTHGAQKAQKSRPLGSGEALVRGGIPVSYTGTEFLKMIIEICYMKNDIKTKKQQRQ